MVNRLELAVTAVAVLTACGARSHEACDLGLVERDGRCVDPSGVVDGDADVDADTDTDADVNADAGTEDLADSGASNAADAGVVDVASTCDLDVARLVLDDGFENAESGGEVPAGSVISGWTVEAGNVDVLTDGLGFFGLPHTGTQALDLNGTVAGTISRVVATQTGEHYVLCFAFTRNPDGPATATGTLFIDGSATLDLASSAANSYWDLQWEMAAVEVVSSAETTEIELASTVQGVGGLFLDSFQMAEEGEP